MDAVRHALLGNYQLVLGYAAHSGNALLLILALRDGELSMLYPIIALTYVWVNLLSMYFFHEQMNVWKALGIALVIGGVALARAREFAHMSKTPLSSILLVLLASLIGSFGAVFLKMGAAHLNRGFRYILNWQLGFGIALFLGSSVPFVMGLRHGELSVLVPHGFTWLRLDALLVEVVFQRADHQGETRRAGHDPGRDCLHRRRRPVAAFRRKIPFSGPRTAQNEVFVISTTATEPCALASGPFGRVWHFCAGM